MALGLWSVIDIETTGISPATDEIIDLGFLQFDGTKLVRTYSSLVRCENPVSSFITKLTGITNDLLKKAPMWTTVEVDLLSLEGHALLAHNANFDMTVLRKLFQLYKIDNPSIKYIDSLEIARKMLPRLQNHRLNTVCEYFGIELNHHDALSDARGSCLIALNAMAALEDFDLQLLIDKLDLRIGYII